MVGKVLNLIGKIINSVLGASNGRGDLRVLKLSSENSILGFSLSVDSIVVALTVGRKIILGLVLVGTSLINDGNKVGDAFNGILMSF